MVMRFELDLSPSHPTNLPDLERRLEARLIELEKLHRERPSLPTAMQRAKAGERIDELLDEIAEIQRMISSSGSRTSPTTRPWRIWSATRPSIFWASTGASI